MSSAERKETMTDFVVAIAGKTARVNTTHESTRDYCKGYLCAKLPEFSVQVLPEDLILEREKSAREDIVEGRSPQRHSDAYLETIALQRKVVEEFFAYDTLLFHGSVVAVDGEAYLFTAKSGTGKSTHTRLWREMLGERAVMVNDDKPFLEIKPEGVTAWGSPWMGKHRLGTNIDVPLKAICILERGEENRISPIRAQEALPMLMQQSQRPQDRKNLLKYMELVDQLSQKTEFYRMSCNMDPQAAVVAYEAMSGKRKED